MIFLEDPQGLVRLRYAGEYLEGVAPRKNLYLIDSGGRVRGIRYFPGIPPRILQSLFDMIR